MGQVQSEVAAAVDQGEQISSAAPPDPQAAPATAATTSSLESLIAGTSLYAPALCLCLCLCVCVYLCMPTSICRDL
jgi:hypothetical protein